MKTPKNSSLFVRKTDPKSGAPYYVLKEKKCKYQQGFYFVNDSMSEDGRYLWFYAAINPIYDGFLRNMGYVDFLNDEVVICYDIVIDDTSPYVDPKTGTVYYTKGTGIFKREPGRDKLSIKLCEVPIGGFVRTVSSHLTPLSDKKRFLLDVQRHNFGNIQGTINIETGEFCEWSHCEHQTAHAQINPQNDKLGLFGYETQTDISTGKKIADVPVDENGIYQRLWTIDSDGNRTCYAPKNNYATHEWWSSDGKKIFYCCDNHGIYGINLDTGTDITILEGVDPWHAHCTRDESLFVWDEKKLERYGGQWYRGCPAAVNLLNRKTGKNLVIVTEMPENEFTPKNQCKYHIDPHPRFVCGDKYIVFSTTELGGCDLAIALVEELLPLTE